MNDATGITARLSAGIRAIAGIAGLGGAASLDGVQAKWDARRLRARRTVIANIAARGLAFATFVVVSRIALADLGETRFGIWMTISSLLMLLTFLDLGVGNGLVSPIARAHAADDAETVGRIVTQGLAITSVIGLAISIAAICASMLGPVELLFPGISPAMLDEARIALVCFSVLIGLSPPLGAIGRIFLGMQRGHIPHYASVAGSLITIALIWIFGGRGGVSITGYILMTFGFTQISAFVTGLVLVKERRIRPSILAASRWNDYRVLLGTGGLFFGLQITVMLGWGLDQSFISALQGPAAVASFAVAARIFMLVSQPLSIWNGPLWSSYADAISQGDGAFVRQTFRRSVIGTAGGAILGVVLILILGRPIWTFFTDGHLRYDAMLMVSFAIWAFCDAIGGALAMYLNGAHIVRQQLIAMVVFVALVLPTKLMVIDTYGLALVPLVTSACYVFTLALMYGVVFRRSLLAPMRVKVIPS
jgi:O-antigen/teichoic acid export membrane protein